MARFNIRWAVFLAVFVLSSVYFFVFGESGIIERTNLEKDKSAMENTIASLKSENNGLRKRLEQYRKGHYTDEDYLESGYVRQGGKLLLFKGLSGRAAPGKEEKAERAAVSELLPYFRILWVALSAVVVLGLFLYNKKLKSRVPT